MIDSICIYPTQQLTESFSMLNDLQSMWKTFLLVFITDLKKKNRFPRLSRKRAHRLQLLLRQWTAERKNRNRKRSWRQLWSRVKSTVKLREAHWSTISVTKTKMTSVMKSCPNYLGVQHVCLFQSILKSVDIVLKSFAIPASSATNALSRSRETGSFASSAKARIRRLFEISNQKSYKTFLTR